MPIRELRDQYNTRDAHQAINRAIRQECLAGDQILDALGELDSIVQDCRDGYLATSGRLSRLLCLLREAKREMADDVAQRWGLRSRDRTHK